MIWIIWLCKGKLSQNCLKFFEIFFLLKNSILFNFATINLDLFLLRPDEVFDENEIRFYAAQLILALEAIHSHQIIYRDLKLENVVMGDDGYIQLIDFGL